MHDRYQKDFIEDQEPNRMLCQRFPAILKKSLILQTDQYTRESMATALLMLGDAGCLGLSQPFSLHTAAAPNFQQQGLWDP